MPRSRNPYDGAGRRGELGRAGADSGGGEVAGGAAGGTDGGAELGGEGLQLGGIAEEEDLGAAGRVRSGPSGGSGGPGIAVQLFED